jgi:opacity protein-like surface antigen
MRRVIKGFVVLGAAAFVSAPAPARADAFVIPFIGTTFSTPDVGSAENGKVTFGGALGSVGGGGIWGFDVDFGYTPKFFGDIPGIDNNLFTVMADVSAGPSITSRGGRGVRPYVNFGIGLVHTKFGSSSDNNFGWNAGGGVTAMFSSNVGIRGEARYTRTVNNDSFSNTISLSDGGFHFWRATIGLVIQ